MTKKKIRIAGLQFGSTRILFIDFNGSLFLQWTVLLLVILRCSIKRIGYFGDEGHDKVLSSISSYLLVTITGKKNCKKWSLRVSMGLIVSRKTTKNLFVRRKN